MGFHPKNTVHKMGRPKNIGVHSTGYSLETDIKTAVNNCKKLNSAEFITETILQSGRHGAIIAQCLLFACDCENMHKNRVYAGRGSCRRIISAGDIPISRRGREQHTECIQLEELLE